MCESRIRSYSHSAFATTTCVQQPNVAVNWVTATSSGSANIDAGPSYGRNLGLSALFSGRLPFSLALASDRPLMPNEAALSIRERDQQRRIALCTRAS